MSDGSEVLTGRDPATFAAVWQLRVTKNGRPLRSLNELEFISGHIYANVWQSDEIVVIDPGSGAVAATIDCAPLVRETRRRVPWAGVLNGIAYDSRRHLVLVTGKNWDRIYALRLKG
jgi:glutaminyl-peptide cyclotransferase